MGWWWPIVLDYWYLEPLFFSRRLFPFSFGQPTGTQGFYMRTCPRERMPGYYPSQLGWFDPYAVIAEPETLKQGGFQPLIVGGKSRTPQLEVPRLASTLAQETVPARYSGMTRIEGEGQVEIDGVKGGGEAFMLGIGTMNLPDEVKRHAREHATTVESRLGSVEYEWVWDGQQFWIVQLSSVQSHGLSTSRHTDLEQWVEFSYEGPHHIETFRTLVFSLRGKNIGIRVRGKVSPLSHAGQIARQYGVEVSFVDPLS